VTARPGATEPKPLPAGLALPDLPGAVCKGEAPDPWFPSTGKSPAAGKAACRACPARTECLEWALANGEQLGTRGGTTPDERKEILRQRRQAAGQGAAPSRLTRTRA
jgi:WhiB family transcriptional regulator, redox-sensing transcriptional regulator